MDVLKTFKQYFREKAAPIINQAEKQKFILPFNNNLSIENDFLDIDGVLLLNSLVNKILTPRQMECCALLMRGKTAREISLLLNLSARTVEYYINIIKIKLDCKNKTELVLKLSKLMNR